MLTRLPKLAVQQRRTSACGCWVHGCWAAAQQRVKARHKQQRLSQSNRNAELVGQHWHQRLPAAGLACGITLPGQACRADTLRDAAQARLADRAQQKRSGVDPGSFMDLLCQGTDKSGAPFSFTTIANQCFGAAPLAFVGCRVQASASQALQWQPAQVPVLSAQLDLCATAVLPQQALP